MAHDKNCHPFPIEPAPFAPGGECHPRPPRPPRPDPCCPPPLPGCGPSQYVGARYVPKFADPIEWDTERCYESLTIVTYKGESYTSKCPVPPGIDIKNERYWALTGAYNAQVEEYKNQVKDLSEQVTGFASDNKEFRDKITQYDKDNAEMKNSVASTVARVDALAERVDTADAAISDLQAGQAQTVKDIAALEAKDADLQRQISSNDTDISAIQAKDREQDARLSAIETVNDAQAATLTQNTQDIARNTENIQDNAASIAVNSKELAKHAEQLKDHAAQLSVLHKEVTDNHTAIERLTSVTDGLRADLTEDEAKIAQNADAIAHIQQKDVQQDGRLDALEGRATTAEGRLDALDTKTDATNAALTAETNRAKAAEVANGKLIAANAKELADHAAELADHEKRITTLEGDNATNKQKIADIEAKNTAQDTAIQQAQDTANHKVDQSAFDAANTLNVKYSDAIQNRISTPNIEVDSSTITREYLNAAHGLLEQSSRTWNSRSLKNLALKTEVDTAQSAADKANTTIGDWATAHPNQTITQCVSSMESELTEHAGDIASLQTGKANKSEIPDVSGFVTTDTYNAGQAAQNELINKKVDQWADSYQRTKCVAMFAAVNKQEDGTMELFGVFPAGNGLRKNPNTSPFSLAYGEGGTVRIFKPDGTEVDKTNIKASYNNWGQAYNMMPTLRVTLKPTFTPDSPFYILLYQNDASKPENL